MAENGKTEHIPESTMERFGVRSLSEVELTEVARHLSACPVCQADFVSTLRRQRGEADLSFTLAPEFWLRHEHLDYDQLLNLAEDKLDATDREFMDAHFKVCPPCREDVRSFLAFRRQIAPELKVSYAPVEQLTYKQPSRAGSSRWLGLAWKPAYATAFAVVGIALVIAAVLLLRPNGRQNLHTQQAPTATVSPGVGSDYQVESVPSPSITPNESREQPSAAKAMMVLNDQGRTITVDRDGNVSGLNDVPAPTRDLIATALLTDKLEVSAIVKELAGEDATLRGKPEPESFKLISPARTVITSNQPTFRWEELKGSSSYRVYVTDQAGNEVAKSEELSAGSASWVSTRPLKRGQIYTWTVVADVDGKEVVSPGPDAAEMKFQVLSADSHQRLNFLKGTRSHLALGVFYARVGMLSEAEQEFQILVRHNPRSQNAAKLLRQIQSWKS